MPEEVDAPYLFTYYSRKALDKAISELDPESFEYWQSLMDYILSMYAYEYEVADALIERSMVS